MKKIPLRTCVITKEKLPKQELIRVVRTPEGNVVVALYNYTANKLKLKGTQHVAMEVALPEGEYKVSHYRLDADYGNTYTAWKKLGYKNDLSQMEREQVVSAGEKLLWYPEETFTGDIYTDKIVLTDDAVSVIKFTKVK